MQSFNCCCFFLRFRIPLVWNFARVILPLVLISKFEYFENARGQSWKMGKKKPNVNESFNNNRKKVILPWEICIYQEPLFCIFQYDPTP